jgi:toxin HigB-1
MYARQRFSLTLVKRGGFAKIGGMRCPLFRPTPLSGGRAGQMSIRINDQWRVCFVWQDGDASDVEIVDYH